MVHEGVLFVAGDARTGFTFEDKDGVPHERAIRAGGGKVRVVKSQDVNSLALDDSVCAENGTEDGSAFPRVPLKAPTRFAPPVSFDSLSEGVDAPWWRENKRRFQWNDRRRALEVVPGVDEGRAESTPRTLSDDGITGPSLAELIGHEDVVACLRTSIGAARELGKPLAPILFSGPPGVGKTALSLAVARELGVRLHKLHGSALRDPGFLAGWLASGERHDLVFVDEIHAVPHSLCEMLYEAMDRRRLTLPVIRGAESKTLTIELEPMSLVAATTHLAELPEALRSRFRMLLLDLLSEQDLEKIVNGAAASLGMAIDGGAAVDLARASKGVPRQALALLRHAGDVACGKAIIEREHVRQALRELGIDDRGLDATDRKILDLLGKSRSAVSQSRIAMMASLPLATYRDVVEPYLLRAGWIEVTPRGRVAVGV
jgi:Holliday junction DNA helicase RuvB